MTVYSSWLARLKAWRWWLLALLVLVLIRVALPLALRPVLEGQASERLHAHVHIGNVDLALYRGGIALKDVQVRLANPPASADEQPVIAWKRLAVAVRWLPLFKKRILLRELILEGPQVAVDREANGTINALALVPAATPPSPSPTPAPASTSTWTVGANRLVLRDGSVRLRDFTVKGSPPLLLHIEGVQLTDVALAPDVYREPSQLRLALTVEGGSLEARAKVDRSAGGQAIEANLEAHNLPLRRVPYYVHAIGWRALEGHVDAQLAYRFDSGGQNEVRGAITLRDLDLRVPGVEPAVLTCRRFSLQLDPFDLAGRRVHVSTLEIEGAGTEVMGPGGERFPLWAAIAPQTQPAAVQSTPATAPAWHWSLGQMQVKDSHVRFQRSGAPLDLGLELTASDLADTADRPGPVHLVGTVGSGSLTVDGNLLLKQLGFAGTIRSAALPLTELSAVAGIAPLDLVQGTDLESQLLVEAGLSTGTDRDLAARDVRVRGHVSLAGFAIANPAGGDAMLRTKSVDLALDEVLVPGVLPGGEPANPAPLRVALGALQITGLQAKVIRTPEGISLPILPGSAVPASPPAGQASRSESSEPPPSSQPSAEISIETLQLKDANLSLEDRTVKPVFNGTIAPLTIEARDLHWPALAVADLRIKGTTERGKISVSGSMAHNKGQFTVNTDDLALPPFNPYATTLAGYHIGQGRASVTTKVTIANGRYDAHNALVLHDLAVHGAGGESAFQEAFGLPLSMALALMRDPHGDIALDIPVQIDQQGLRVGVWEVVKGAIKRAIMGALTAPLKMLGAVFGKGGKVEAATPTGIGVRPGRDVPTPDGEKQADQLATLLTSHPDLKVTLATGVSEQDVRWLHEQALLAQWKKEGFFSRLKDLPQRSARKAVRQALEERAQDKEGKLDPEDAAALERWLNEIPPPTAAQLHALGEARLSRVEQLLQGHGVAAPRVARGAIRDTPTPDAPTVNLELSPL